MESLPSSVQLLLASAVASSVIWLLYSRLLLKKSAYPLPPSPSGALPFIGHYFINPTINPEGKYIEWGKELGKYPSKHKFNTTAH